MADLNITTMNYTAVKFCLDNTEKYCTGKNTRFNITLASYDETMAQSIGTVALDSYESDVIARSIHMQTLDSYDGYVMEQSLNMPCDFMHPLDVCVELTMNCTEAYQWIITVENDEGVSNAQQIDGFKMKLPGRLCYGSIDSKKVVKKVCNPQSPGDMPTVTLSSRPRSKSLQQSPTL